MRRSQFLAGIGTSAIPARGLTSAPTVLRLAASPLAHDINPYRDPEIGVDEISWLFGDGLVGWDRTIQPLLAGLPEVDPEGKRYRYHLRPRAWHDGRALRAADVAAALKIVRATPFGNREPYRSVRDLVVHDDRSFDVLVDSARPGFARSFFGAYGRPGLPLLRSDSDGVPIGTGPFRVVTRVEPGLWRLARFDGSPRGRPAVDRIDLRLLSLSATGNIQLLSGEADIALPLTPTAFASESFRRVERYTSTAVLLLNAATLFGDLASRTALARSVDVMALQHAYDRRRTALHATLLLSGENDRNFARLLQHDTAATGVLRDMLRSREVTIAYARESPAHERTATLLQQQLREIGITSALHPAPFSTYLGEEGPLRTGRFDIALSGLIYGEEPDVAADWACAARPPLGGNFSRWCDPDFELAAARYDRGGMLRRLYDTMACIPLSRAYEDIGIARRVGGFTVPEPLTPATYGCTRWSIIA